VLLMTLISGKALPRRTLWLLPIDRGRSPLLAAASGQSSTGPAAEAMTRRFVVSRLSDGGQANY